jgi:hypothetical protein
MGFWDTNDITAARLNRLGPWFDEYVGTEGNYQDLKAAYDAGARRMLIGPGASLSAALTIAADNVAIVSVVANPKAALAQFPLAYPLTISGNQCYLDGIAFNSVTGVAITVTGDDFEARRLAIYSSSSHGIYLNNTYNDAVIEGCWIISNGGDGVKTIAGCDHTRIHNCIIYGSTGWGINDAAGNCLEGCNRLDGNSGGAINGGTSYTNGTSKIS